MANIENNDLFGIFARSTRTVLESYRAEQGLDAGATPPDISISLEANTPWYRYVGYRPNIPQPEKAGRTQHLPLEYDTSNRWTGQDPDGGGRQGLYFSEEFINEHEPFPELTHYQRPGARDGERSIAYYEYTGEAEGGLDPQAKIAKATNLRTMFLFTQETDLDGVDLRLHPDGPDGEPNKFLTDILKEAQQDPKFARSAAIDPASPLSELQQFYTAENADFCRAVGNTVLAETDTSFLRTSSVRDLNSGNIVARTEAPVPPAKGTVLEGLKPQGRATYFVNEAGERGQSGFTISDMLYNAAFEDPALAPEGFPTVAQATETLTKARRMALDVLVAKVEDVLATQPGSGELDAVLESIAELREQLEDSADPADIRSTIETLNVRIDAVSGTAPAEFKDILALSERAANAMDAMTEAEENARQEDRDPPDGIEDPDVEDLDPDAVEGVPEHA